MPLSLSLVLSFLPFYALRRLKFSGPLWIKVRVYHAITANTWQLGHAYLGLFCMKG
jgi:hypothetical protein